MDNLLRTMDVSAHQLLEAAAATRLVLAFRSPDRNPIETAFAGLTAMLRTAAGRSGDGLCSAICRIAAASQHTKVRQLLRRRRP